jgi:hypothetical protein
VESVIFTILLASGIRLVLAAKIKSNEGGSGPLARLCLAWPRRPARALWDLLDRSAVPLASTKGRTRLRLGVMSRDVVA